MAALCAVEDRNALNNLNHVEPEVDRAAKVKALCALLPSVQSPSGAGFIAIWIGAAVEGGSDPTLSVRPVLDAFFSWIDRVETSADEEAEDPEPDPVLIQGLQFYGNAVVSHIARLPEERERLSADQDLLGALDRISHLSYGAMWVLTLLRQRSGELAMCP